MTFKESQRRRFHELTAQAEEIRSVSAPLREARDAFVNTARAKEQEMNAEIKAAEAGLAKIEAERVFLARGLGNVGEA